MVLAGETGSGKSTQLPQMLLAEPWFKRDQAKTGKGGNIGGCIAITQPRRVAAISLAKRVAEEMGTTVGGLKGRVGYSVRFDHCAGPDTKIKYLTEGMLLQEMLRDPWLKQYSAVVVDEVHERASNVDLILGFLKKMVVRKEGVKERGGKGLKVCVMSATADVERLVKFLGEEKADTELNGIDKPESEPERVQEEQESEWEGIASTDDEKKPQAGQSLNTRHSSVKEEKSTPKPNPRKQALMNGNAVVPQQPALLKGNVTTNGTAKTEHESKAATDFGLPADVAVCYIEGRQYPVSIFYTAQPVGDFMDASLQTIIRVHRSEPMPGDILVFLTGQEVVENLEELLNEYAQGLAEDLPKMLVYPLFAALPQTAQQRVFQPAPRGTRKVILSTNIAETSITVSGVRFVVDCGKAKIKHFRPQVGLESLLVKPISKSSAIQRKGRAGREAEGKCWRLYTEDTYLQLERNNTPEILRSDLSQVILTMKARGVDDIATFPFLSPPPRESMARALTLLHQLDALSSEGTITKIGCRMAHLPLSAPLSRSLIAAATPQLSCLEDVIDIISALSVETLFLSLSSEEKKEAASVARSDLLRREGDHLILLATVRAYAAEHSDRKGWCERRFISHRAMRAVLDVRKQLRSHFHLPASQPAGEVGETMVESERTERILRAFLTGFKMNTARLMPDGSYRTLAVGSQSVAIHPSSVLHGRKVECVMYNEFVFTNKAYARGVSAVQMDWVGEVFDAEGGGSE